MLLGEYPRIFEEGTISFNEFYAHYRDLFADTAQSGEMDAALQLLQIRQLVNTRQLPSLYLIIDEYDNFTNQPITTHQDALYREVTSGDSFLRTFSR